MTVAHAAIERFPSFTRTQEEHFGVIAFCSVMAQATSGDEPKWRAERRVNGRGPSKSRSKTITRDPSWLGPAVAPGEILLEEFLKPLELGQVEAARQLDISLNRLNEIVLGKRGITADTALRLARMLKTSPQFWMRLQADWDLHQAMVRAAQAS